MVETTACLRTTVAYNLLRTLSIYEVGPRSYMIAPRSAAPVPTPQWSLHMVIRPPPTPPFSIGFGLALRSSVPPPGWLGGLGLPQMVPSRPAAE